MDEVEVIAKLEIGKLNRNEGITSFYRSRENLLFRENKKAHPNGLITDMLLRPIEQVVGGLNLEISTRYSFIFL